MTIDYLPFTLSPNYALYCLGKTEEVKNQDKRTKPFVQECWPEQRPQRLSFFMFTVFVAKLCLSSLTR